jgi:hypothetical protein
MSHTLLIVLYLVLYAAFFGLVFWLTSAIGKGKGWSRVVITVLVAINLLLIIWMLAEYPFAALQANLQARGTSVTLYLLMPGLRSGVPRAGPIQAAEPASASRRQPGRVSNICTVPSWRSMKPPSQ